MSAGVNGIAEPMVAEALSVSQLTAIAREVLEDNFDEFVTRLEHYPEDTILVLLYSRRDVAEVTGAEKDRAQRLRRIEDYLAGRDPVFARLKLRGIEA